MVASPKSDIGSSPLLRLTWRVASLACLTDINLNMEDRDVVSVLSRLPSQPVITVMPVDVHRLSPVLPADRQLYHEQIANAITIM